MQISRKIAPAGPTALWAAPEGVYALERWDINSGKRTSRVPVRSTWFTVPSTALAQGPHLRPEPIIQALWAEHGLVWFLIRVADREWKASPATGGETVLDQAQRNAMYDWVLEAVEPETGRIVASRRFPEFVSGRTPQPFLISREAASGVERLVVSRMTLRQATSGGNVGNVGQGGQR